MLNGLFFIADYTLSGGNEMFGRTNNSNSSKSSGIIRERIVFRGDVQGVGFRYTAKYTARNYGLTGWVMNEWDGSVIMEVQGPREVIDLMILNLKEDRYIGIDDIERTSIRVEEDETKFKVRFN